MHIYIYIYIYICSWRSAYSVDRDSSVGIATGCRLDGPEIESRCGGDFPHPSRPALGATQPPVPGVPAVVRGVKPAGAWC